MRNLNRIKGAIIHCSDSDIKAHDNIATITKWHKARNFKDVGYHYFIRKNGTLEVGRLLSETGAHCIGKNASTIGICLSGRNKFTEAQFITLANVLKLSNQRLKTTLEVNGHNEFSKKSCPNFDVEEFKTKYAL